MLHSERVPPMISTFSVEDFGEFFSTIHGFQPFPWQLRLVRQIDQHRRWPDRFDLPTGSGKTAVVDVALFLLALDMQRSPEQRWCPRRVAFVVDRRVIVDQTHQRALLIAQHLSKATATDVGIVGAVADALRLCTDNTGAPIQVVRLRGGVALDDSWIRRPDQPLVITSTVDQIGSRLLFQGYGVSRSMRPVHAGLLSNDTLVVLDEVHLSQPFAQTLRQIRYILESGPEQGAGNRWHFTELSATPNPDLGDNAWVFGPDPNDDDASGPAAVLRQRIEAAKPAALQAVRTSRRDGAQARSDLADAAAAAALRLLHQPGIRTVAVVVNRVDTAERTHNALTGSAENNPIELVLLTGRMRPIERDRLVQAVAARVHGGRERSHDEPPLVVVATQCIEAGADYDFDGLITECASLDALRQRFGRLDRFGKLTASGSTARAVVLGPSDAVAPGSEDPIYGQSQARTWQWLQTQVDNTSHVDFAVGSLRVPDDPGLLPPRPDAPYLLPSTLDVWYETPLGSATSMAPPVDPWLHGPATVSADVSVVWRADLTETLLRLAIDPSEDTASNQQNVLDMVAVCRPLEAEALPVPISAVRAWLAEADPIPVGDVEGELNDHPTISSNELRPFVVWRGETSAVTRRPDALRPGATIIVPSTYGGLHSAMFVATPYRWWSPAGTEPVPDLGDQGHSARGGVQVRRLLAPTIAGWDPDQPQPPLPAERPEDLSPTEHLAPWWAEHNTTGTSSRLHTQYIREFSGFDQSGNPSSWYVLLLPTKLPNHASTGSSESPVDLQGDIDSEPDTSSFIGSPAQLHSHLAGVAAKAAELARRCGLPEPMVGDLALAATLHDVGKADERFQSWLYHGNPRRSDQPLLAKSTSAAPDRQERRQARLRAHYPDGARHEALSLAMIAGSLQHHDAAFDWDLVRHLVVSHHGWARPFLPAWDDPHPCPVVFDHADGSHLAAMSNQTLASAGSGVAERFWTLVERYGWYGLARLESILRLADHRRSEEEQMQGMAR